MTEITNLTDTQRVLQIIESLVDHVPPDIKLELNHLVKLLTSPLFSQYLDVQDLNKISRISDQQVTHKSATIGELCDTAQKLRLSAVENCSNISTEECKHNAHGEKILSESDIHTVQHDTDIHKVQHDTDTTSQSPCPMSLSQTLGQHQDRLLSLEEIDKPTVTQSLEERDNSTVTQFPRSVFQDTRVSSPRIMSQRKISIHKETVVLSSDAGEPLGFDVCGAVDQDNSGPVRVFVNKIITGGLADRAGRLKEGDEIIGINDEMIDNNVGGSEGWQLILGKLSEHKGNVSLLIKRKVCVPVPVLEHRIAALPENDRSSCQDIAGVPPPRTNSLSLIHRKIIICNEGEVLKPLCVELVNTGTGLGFGIIDDVYGNVRVNTILPDGPALKEGTLKPRDVILEINEAHVRGINQQNIAKLLKCASPNVTLVVGRPVCMDLHKCSVAQSDLSLMIQPLTRCTDTGGIMISQQVLNTSGALQCGDIVLQIYDVNVDILPLDRIREMLHTEPATVPVLFTKSSREKPAESNHSLPINDEEDADQTVIQYREEYTEELTEVWTSEIRYVEFDKTTKCLGISISPYKDPTKASKTIIVIDDIQPDSGLYDKIPIGSRLLSVNDKVFNDCSFEIVTKVLKMTANGLVRLGITELIHPPTSLYCDELQKPISQTVITVQNNSDFPGITLKPSEHTLIPGYEVCSIISGGLFHMDGRMKTGDIIVSLNYADINSMFLANVRNLIEMSCHTNTPLRVDYVEKEETFLPYTVVVPRQPTGIGICITGGSVAKDNTVNDILIKKIVDIKSPLKKGEQILKVNDISMSGKTHDEAVEILKTATSPLTLTLQTPRNCSDKSTTELDTFDVMLPRTRGSLGVDIGTSELGLVVTRVEENSVADVMCLKPGDVIFKVNDTVLKGMPQDMMIPVLRQQDGPTNVTVVRKPPRTGQVTPINSQPSTPVMGPKHDLPQLPSSKREPSQRLSPKREPTRLSPGGNSLSSTSQEKMGSPGTGTLKAAFAVNIQKSGTTSLGINVVQKGGGIFVKNIVPDFPASQCSNLKPGDQILAVNGTPLAGMSRIKAIAVLRRVEGDVKLLLVRPTVTAVTNVSSSASDKENTPEHPKSSGASTDQRGSSCEQLDTTSIKSDPDLPTMIRTDQIIPENLSLRSWNFSDKRRSPGPASNSGYGSYNSINKVEYADVELVRKSPDTVDLVRNSPDLVRNSPDLVRNSPDLVRNSPDLVRNSPDLVRNSPVMFDRPPSTTPSDKVQLNKQGSVRSATPTERSKTPTTRNSPVLKRSKHTNPIYRSRDSLSSVHSDRRISWHGSPIEVDKINVQIKNTDSGAGIILISHPHAQGILVKSITPNSPSQQLVWPQDIISQLNGQNTAEMPVSDAAIMLSEKGSSVDLEILRDSPLYETIKITLAKPKSGSLGLSITERRSLPGIYISQITTGGVAEKQESLKKGQRILEINGKNVKYMRQNEFIKILKNCGSKVHLVVGSPIMDDNRSMLSSSTASARQSYSPIGAGDNSQHNAATRSEHTNMHRTQSPQHSPHSSHRGSLQHSPHLSHRNSPQPSHHSQVSHHSHGSPRSHVSHQSPLVSRHASQTPSQRSSQRSVHSPTRSPHLSNRSPPRSPAGSLRSTSRRSDTLSQRSQRSYQTPTNMDERPVSSLSQHSDHWSQPAYNTMPQPVYNTQGSDHSIQRHPDPAERPNSRQSGSYQPSRPHHSHYPDHDSRSDNLQYPEYNSPGSYMQPAHSVQSVDRRSGGSNYPNAPNNNYPNAPNNNYPNAPNNNYPNAPNNNYPNAPNNNYPIATNNNYPNAPNNDYSNPPSHYGNPPSHYNSPPCNYSNPPSNYSNPPQPSEISSPTVPAFRTAYLHREKSTPLGMSIGGGRGWPLGSIPLFISSLQVGGLASRTGVLKEHDRIVSINGKNVDGFSHEDAVMLLREATSPVTLVVTDPDSNRPNFKVVKLKRGKDGFGFSIVGGVNTDPALPITVKAVYETGSAYGKLKRGDQVISVNGKSIENYTREETTSLLKSCTETVTLVIQ